MPAVHDWHRPRDPNCAQNHDPEHADCTCPRPPTQRKKKPYRTIRVDEGASTRLGGPKVRPRLVLRVWPNGVIGVREHGRRAEYFTTAGSLYYRLMVAEAFRAARLARAGKKGRRRS